jgi:hypothetical protein
VESDERCNARFSHTIDGNFESPLVQFSVVETVPPLSEQLVRLTVCSRVVPDYAVSQNSMGDRKSDAAAAGRGMLDPQNPASGGGGKEAESSPTYTAGAASSSAAAPGSMRLTPKVRLLANTLLTHTRFRSIPFPRFRPN